jgi:RNA polymerase sigma factor (sigma-70 family)
LSQKKRMQESHEEDLVRLYLDDIGQYPLLTKDDEARLAQAIEAGREARAELGAGKPTATRRRQLRTIIRDAEEAERTFVNANLRLVVSIAKKYQWSGLTLLDLVQEGNLGLMHAVEKFDWRKGFKFSTYATWWIRQAIGRGIDNSSRTVRLPSGVADEVRRLRRTGEKLEAELGRPATTAELADAVGSSEAAVIDLMRHAQDTVSLDTPRGEEGDGELGDVVADAGAASPFDSVLAGLMPDEIDRLLRPLEAREREVLRLRFGLDRGDPRTLDEVGIVLDLTGERIRRIEKSALNKLREQLVGTEARELLAS